MATAPLKLKRARLPLGLPRAARPRSASEFAAARMPATRPGHHADAAAPEVREPSPPAVSEK